MARYEEETRTYRYLQTDGHVQAALRGEPVFLEGNWWFPISVDQDREFSVGDIDMVCVVYSRTTLRLNDLME